MTADSASSSSASRKVLSSSSKSSDRGNKTILAQSLVLTADHLIVGGSDGVVRWYVAGKKEEDYMGLVQQAKGGKGSGSSSSGKGRGELLTSWL